MASKRATPAGRKLLIAGNWKMNQNHLEAIALVQKVAFTVPERYFRHVEIAVIPPCTDLRSVQTLIDGDKLELSYGAQDLSAHDSGAYTGEVSGAMLAKLGCSYVTVGHSERRAHHAETDDVVAGKVQAALRHGLTPILCVGEGLAVREAGDHLAHTTGQLRAALEGITADEAQHLVVAYEPVWAIGTGRVATPTDAQEVCQGLRQTLSELYGDPIAQQTRILYGGSVKSSNVADITSQDDIDGALVGGASLDGTEFATLAANAVGILA